jgi:hypothetical protein
MLYRSILHSGGFAGGILAVVVLLLFYVFAIRGIYYVIRLLSPRSLIEAIARAVLHTFQQNGTIRSNQVRLEISGTNDGLYIYTTLRGGTLREKQQFAETMKELLSPMDNPRYVVLRYMLRFPQYYYSLPCPSLIGNNRENVEVFEKELRKQIGKASVVYVRNDIGHQVYRKCVKRSFVNYKINENGVIVRKEVF